MILVKPALFYTSYGPLSTSSSTVHYDLENNCIKNKTDVLRIKNRGRLSDELNSRLGAMDEEWILQLAEKAVIPFTLVARPAQLLNDPHLKEAGQLLDTKLPGGKTLGLPKIPLAVVDHPLGLHRNPPRLGEGGRAFLMKSGFSMDRVEQLVQAQVLIDDRGGRGDS
jgi:crotonobetainyl-CoA:carnitine CoA-transferase CaiB-like acyl-CoA transferase